MKCKFFRCAQKALVKKRMSKTVIYFCKWAGDLCQGPECKFAMCAKHAMNPDGTCRESAIQQRTKTERREHREEELEKKVRMSEKAQRAIREIKKYMDEAGLY